MHLSDFYSGSDTWDDAFSNAIKSMPASGGEIQLPAFPIHIQSAIRDYGKDYVVIQGNGYGSRVIADSLFQCGFTVENRAGWRFRNLTLIGTGRGRFVELDKEGSGLHLISCHEFDIDNCQFDNWGIYDGIGAGIAAIYLRKSCTFCVIHRCRFNDNNCAVNEDAYEALTAPYGNSVSECISRRARAHFIIDNFSASGAKEGMKISKVSMYGHPDDNAPEHFGVRIVGATGVILSDLDMHEVSSGVEIHVGAHHCIVDSVNVLDMVKLPYTLGGHGIWFRSPGSGNMPTFNTISNCNIKDAIGHGIFYESGFQNSVIGSQIISPNRDGVRQHAPYLRIIGNTIVWPGENGICVSGSSGSLHAVGNFIEGDRNNTSLSYDGVRIDGTGGPVFLTGNSFWNDQMGVGFKYGVNRTSSIDVTLGFNKFFCLTKETNGI